VAEVSAPLFTGDPTTGAEFSLDRTYRYALWRTWSRQGRSALFVMLNPSTADETQNDPTIRRCIAFARRWGYGSLTVCNLFALRSTDPAALYSHADPVGPDNDEVIAGHANGAGIVIAAWGVHGALRGRGRTVAEELEGAGCPVFCLGTTKDGHPRHPLYLRGDVEPVRFAP
jgi:hypothetical protein